MKKDTKVAITVGIIGLVIGPPAIVAFTLYLKYLVEVFGV